MLYSVDPSRNGLRHGLMIFPISKRLLSESDLEYFEQFAVGTSLFRTLLLHWNQILGTAKLWGRGRHSQTHRYLKNKCVQHSCLLNRNVLSWVSENEKNQINLQNQIFPSWPWFWHATGFVQMILRSYSYTTKETVDIAENYTWMQRFQGCLLYIVLLANKNYSSFI
jgi:hypothetical protein